MARDPLVGADGVARCPAAERGLPCAEPLVACVGWVAGEGGTPRLWWSCRRGHYASQALPLPPTLSRTVAGPAGGPGGDPAARKPERMGGSFGSTEPYLH